MATLVTEDLNHEVGASIDDLRNVCEVWRAGDEATEFYDAFDAAEIANGGFALGQQVDAALARGVLAGGEFHVFAKAAFDDAIWCGADLTGHEQHIAADNEGDVICDGGHWRWQPYAQLVEFGFGRAHQVVLVI